MIASSSIELEERSSSQRVVQAAGESSDLHSRGQQEGDRICHPQTRSNLGIGYVEPRRAVILATVSAAPFAASAATGYWSLFNFEEETAQPAVYVTYGSLIDMLNDTNRADEFVSGADDAGENVVGSRAFWLTPIPLPGSGFCSLLTAAAFVRRKLRPSASAPMSAPSRVV